MYKGYLKLLVLGGDMRLHSRQLGLARGGRLMQDFDIVNVSPLVFNYYNFLLHLIKAKS